jgi:hypothetical protein
MVPLCLSVHMFMAETTKRTEVKFGFCGERNRVYVINSQDIYIPVGPV